MARHFSPNVIVAWQQRRDAGLSFARIADIYGTSEATVRRALGGGGTPGARPREDISTDRVLELYAGTGSVRETAEELGCSRTLVTRRLAEHGVIDWPDYLPYPDYRHSAPIIETD